MDEGYRRSLWSAIRLNHVLPSLRLLQKSAFPVHLSSPHGGAYDCGGMAVVLVPGTCGSLDRSRGFAQDCWFGLGPPVTPYRSLPAKRKQLAGRR